MQPSDFARLASMRVPRAAEPSRFEAAQAALAALSPFAKEAGADKEPVGYQFQYDLTWAIEYAKGDMRKGRKCTMHYGFIKGTNAGDGGSVDFWMEPEGLGIELFFVLNQKGKDGGFDEHKVIVGCKTEEEAREKYLENYPPDLGPKLIGSFKAMTLPDFKEWLAKGDMKKEAVEITFKDGGKRDSEELAAEMADKLRRSASDTRESRILHNALCKHMKPFDNVDATEEKPFTVAVDLDGTIAEKQEPFNPGTIGDPRPKAKHYLTAFREAGARIIIFTVRGDKTQVQLWLNKHSLPYDFINENPDQPPGTSGKVLADAYWDDRGHNAEDLDEHGPTLVDLAKGRTKKAASQSPDDILVAIRKHRGPHGS